MPRGTSLTEFAERSNDMGKVHIHVHKKVADAKPYWRVLIDGKLYCTENSDAEAKAMVTKLKADSQHKGKTITSVEASTTAGAGIQGTAPRKLFSDSAEPKDSEKQALIRDFGIKAENKDRAVAERYLRAKGWDLDMAVQAYERAEKTGDHRLDYNKNDPATDAERRDRIQQVVSNCKVTSAVALRWLEAEEWDTHTCIRELKHSMRMGFVIDSKMRDAESDLDREVRAAYKKVCEEFAKQGELPSRAYKAANSEFIAANYKYKKEVGRWHPLERAMDSAAPTSDRGYSEISSMASMLLRQAQRIANLANGDGDAGDVSDMKKQMSNIDATIGDLRRAINSAKPLVTEK